MIGFCDTKMIYTAKNAPYCAVYLQSKRKKNLFWKKMCDFRAPGLNERRVTVWIFAVLDNVLFQLLTLNIELLHYYIEHFR